MLQHEDSIKVAIAQFRDETLMDPDIEQFQSHLKEFTVSVQCYGRSFFFLVLTQLAKIRH